MGKQYNNIYYKNKCTSRCHRLHFFRLLAFYVNILLASVKLWLHFVFTASETARLKMASAWPKSFGRGLTSKNSQAVPAVSFIKPDWFPRILAVKHPLPNQPYIRLKSEKKCNLRKLQLLFPSSAAHSALLSWKIHQIGNIFFGGNRKINLSIITVILLNMAIFESKKYVDSVRLASEI